MVETIKIHGLRARWDGVASYHTFRTFYRSRWTEPSNVAHKSTRWTESQANIRLSSFYIFIFLRSRWTEPHVARRVYPTKVDGGKRHTHTHTLRLVPSPTVERQHTLLQQTSSHSTKHASAQCRHVFFRPAGYQTTRRHDYQTIRHHHTHYMATWPTTTQTVRWST
jgi:hypothetical protein